jgi:hypothetical protein
LASFSRGVLWLGFPYVPPVLVTKYLGAQRPNDSGHADCVGVLVEAGADLGAKNRRGRTALQLAAGKKHAALVALLETAAASSPASKPATTGSSTVPATISLEIAAAAAAEQEEESAAAEAALVASTTARERWLSSPLGRLGEKALGEKALGEKALDEASQGGLSLAAFVQAATHCPVLALGTSLLRAAALRPPPPG